jgi:intraflagellar transport protein 140
VVKAQETYDIARDECERVRLHCVTGNWQEADQVVNKSKERSSMCCLARLIMERVRYLSRPENATAAKGIDQLALKKRVIDLFRQARQFGQAMKTALDFEIVDDIMNLSYSAPQPLVIRAARWFEEQRDAKNAILLYSRANRMNRALSLCFQVKQYDALDEISDALTSKTDQQILLRCAKHFEESSRWSRAAQCFAFAREFDKVIQLCDQHKVKLKAAVITELSEIDADEAVMKRFALLCEQQNAFQIAAQLYVRFKDHIAAMRCLIRSGDTDKVVKFANLIKKKETFILAANYIQTLKPRSTESLFEMAINMYKRAGATEKIAKFYEGVAQVEIDEFQEYARAAELLKLASEVYASLGKDTSGVDAKVKLVELYLAALERVTSEPKKTMAACVEILRTPNVEAALRTDDVYILMVKASVALKNWKNAHQILEDLRGHDTDITWFLPVELIQQIYKEAGDTFQAQSKAVVEGDDDVDMGDIDEIGD